ncbi:hypothetical protein Cni_G17584 [Canna indica]|uniref:PGG domain-containing protein n=1 Tax=Canna indica TaxID=4628 RepID=A0AAQ3KMY3_9LILI|nr:hypothetical protein Cni_G17584 [Canna indica]
MHHKLLKAAIAGDANFIQHVARTNSSLLLELTVEGNSVLHITAKLGYSQLADYVCNLHPSLLILPNSRGDTPLHCAAAAGHLPIVSMCFHRLKNCILSWPERQDRGSPMRVKNNAGNTALHEATRNGYAQVVELLMKMEEELADEVNNAGVSALYMAAEREFSDIVWILLQYTTTSHGGPHGQTALHAAVLRSYYIAKLILEKRPASVKHEDSTKSTPLHFAAANGDLRMVQLLLECDASAAYVQDREGFSAIHVAASAGHLEIIEELLMSCGDSKEQKTENGRNLLHVAIEKKNIEVVKHVLKSVLLEELINEQDNEGNTPLHLAVKLQNKKMIQALLSSRIVDVSLTNNSGYNPLDLASSNARTEIGLRMYKITTDLMAHGSRFSPQRVDYIRNSLDRKKEEEINRFRAMTNNAAIIAVLIATVSFASAFTLPGGYKNDVGPNAGTAILSRKATFLAFLISDALAMASSITVAVILIYSASLDHDVRLRSLMIAMQLLWVAVGSMTVAFVAGVSAVIAHDCKWAAVLVSIIACSVPFGAFIFVHWPSKDMVLMHIYRRRNRIEIARYERFDDMSFITPKAHQERPEQ